MNTWVAQPGRERRALVAVVGAWTAIVAVDQIIKAIVRQSLQPGVPVSVLQGAFSLNLTRNRGAAFGLFQAGGPLFIAVAAGVVAVILANHRRVSSASWPVQVATALIGGGAVGNALDRIRLGYVTDFIDLRWWPVFNFADVMIVTGVGMLLTQMIVPGLRSHARE